MIDKNNFRNIGIIGGIGPDATIEYYSYMLDQVKERIVADNDFGWKPNIIIYSLGGENFSGDAFTKPDKPEQIKAVIESLHRAGAEFCIGACNSLHIVYDKIKDDLPIPWLSIMDATAEAICAAGMNKVGLIGTKMTMTHGFYQKVLTEYGIETIVPPADDVQKIHDLIQTELIWGDFRKETRAYLINCMEEMVSRGAQGVILGCTELPLIVKQKHTLITVLPTTTILAQKALDYAWDECSLKEFLGSGE